MKRIHLTLLVVMNFLWAGSYASFKALSPYLDKGGVTTLRFGLAAVVLGSCWAWLPGKAPRGRDLFKAAVMGIIVFVLAPRLQVAGVQRGQAGDTGVLLAMEPLVTAVAAAIFLREHIGPRRWVGFCLGLAGVILMARVWRPEFRLPDLAANGLVVASFVCETAYSVMGKPLIGRAGLLKVLAVALLAGAVANVCIDGHQTLAAAQTLPLRAWLLIAYLALICTLAGYVLWFVVIQETEVNIVALTVFIQSVVAVGIARLVLGESLHWGQLWGSLAIMTGLVVGLSRQVGRR